MYNWQVFCRNAPILRKQNKKALMSESLMFDNNCGAESRNRTGTLSPARDFESRASTYSAISATQTAIMT